MNIRRVVATASKEWREIVRDRMFLALTFLVPVSLMLVVGYGLSLDVEDIPLAIMDRDGTSLSREYSYRFIDSRYFDFKGYALDSHELPPLLADNKIRAAIIIPENFQKQLLAGRPVVVQTIIDGTFPFRAQTTKGYVLAMNTAFTSEMLAAFISKKRGIPLAEAASSTRPIKLEARYLYNQSMKSDWALAPRLIMVILMMTPPFYTALGIVREKERGSIYNIYSSTVTRLEFLVGKLIPYVGIHDSDHSFASRELIHRFRPPQFSIDGEVFNHGESIELLDRGEAMLVLDIPPQFQESLLNGDTTNVQLQIDTSNPVLGFLATSYGEQIVGQYGLEAAMKREGIGLNEQAAPIIHEEHRVWYNANQNDAWFMSVVEMLNVIPMFAILLPASAMAREKERGTIEQLMVSPLSTFQMMFPKVIAMTSVILVGTFITFHLILQPCFGVPFRGSLTLFMAVTAVYVFTIAAVGMLLATIARNLAQVGMLTALIFIPMVFLSGAWTPPENMPPFLRALSAIAPLHHYIDASLGIMLKGSGIGLLWDSILAIALFGAAIYGLSMGYFRRQLG
jgi:ABC-2 type transport system permease protein